MQHQRITGEDFSRRIHELGEEGLEPGPPSDHADGDPLREDDTRDVVIEEDEDFSRRIIEKDPIHVPSRD
jgi:hypothetical protein